MKPLNRQAKTFLLIALVGGAMSLGVFSQTFDDKPLWWIGIILSISGLAWCLFLFIRDIWKSDI